MTSAYISWFDWQRTTTGLEWSSLVGNTGRLSGSVAVGATSLTVTPVLTAQINQYDVITIFDGPNSEVVSASSTAFIGGSSVSVGATAFAHAAGTPYCTDGVMGSLADQIFKASQWLETICKQPLFLTTYTNELLSMPTMRASINNAGGLHFRPRHWPIQSLTALSIASTPGVSTAYDPTQVFIDSDKQVCSMPNITPLVVQQGGQTPYPVQPTYDRRQEAQLTLTYSAGYAASAMPPDVIEAAVLLVSDILAKRLDPMGAVEVGSGSRRIAAVLRGDNAGESLLYKRAKRILDNYTVQSF